MRLVYKATGKPVQLLDRHTVGGFEIIVDHAPEPHKSDSEGKITFMMPDGSSGPTYYVSIIGAEWIEREDRAHWRDDAGNKPLPAGVLPNTPVNALGNYYAPDGTFMNANGTRNIFDDVDE